MSDLERASESCVCDKELTEEAKIKMIEDVIETYKSKPGCLITVLHLAQEIYGYLPSTIQCLIADKLGFSESYVSGVVSFYSYFSTVARAKHTIKVCMGTACYVRGGQKVVERMEEQLGVSVGELTADGKFSIQITRCLGACGLAPVVMIDEDVHQQVNADQIGKILAKY